MSTVFYHHPHHALVVFDGKLTWPAALELVETLDTVVDTYLGLRSLMFTLRDPVVLLPWPPEVFVPAPVRGIRMLRLSAAARRVGLARSQIYRNIEAGTFPAPTPLGKRVRRWPAHEIDKWMSEHLKRISLLRRDDREWYLRPPSRGDDDRPPPIHPLKPGDRGVTQGTSTIRDEMASQQDVFDS